MLNNNPGLNRVVRLSDVRTSEANRDGDDRKSFGRNTSRAERTSAQEYALRPELPIKQADFPAVSVWQAALAFFMEGFAIYGASLHPTAAFPVRAMLARSKEGQPGQAGDQRSAMAHEHDDVQSPKKSNIIVLENDAWAETAPLRHWSWFGASVETLRALWTHWRREREIKRAVAALAQYDDRILRDMGICGRSDIERMVRYCHDC